MNEQFTILVVDDSAIDRRYVGDHCEAVFRGVAKVRYAVHGADALAALERGKGDIVLTDLVMPEMDGLELVAAMQKRHPDVPVILMTSRGSEEIATRAIAAGAASYIPKRCLKELLAETVNRVMQMRRSAPTGTSVRYFSCFMSHSHEDQEFCDELYLRLTSRSVQLWYSPIAVRSGQKLHDQIRAAVQEYDRLLLVLSASSMSSPWVATEVFLARDRERATGQRVLFPLRLVPYDDIRNWTLFDPDTGRDLAREIREYFVPDFSNWRNPECFDAEVRRLLRDLQIEDD